jgi:hypothetical protein
LIFDNSKFAGGGLSVDCFTGLCNCFALRADFLLPLPELVFHSKKVFRGEGWGEGDHKLEYIFALTLALSQRHIILDGSLTAGRGRRNRAVQSPPLNKTSVFIREIRGHPIFKMHFEEVF